MCEHVMLTREHFKYVMSLVHVDYCYDNVAWHHKRTSNMKNLAMNIPLQQVEMGHDVRQHKQVCPIQPRGKWRGCI